MTPMIAIKARTRARLAVEEMEPRTVPAAAPVVNLTYNDVTITPAIANAYAVDLYGDVLFRAPDAAGLASWDQQMASGLSGAAVFAAFVESDEFAAVVAPLLNMYEGYLSRPADTAGIGNWETDVHSVSSLGQV